MNDLRIGRRLGGGILSLAFIVAACGSAAAPSASPTRPPDAGVTSPPSGDPGGSGNIGNGGAKPVVPKPGQLDVRPVTADQFSATVDGSTIAVTATWTSGVEPCNVLDSIVVDRGADAFTITLREGRGPEDVVCIAIAEQHSTTFEIPDVAPGTYTIRDSTGGAPDVQVVVG